MRTVVLDFETCYGDEYTLSKMSTEAYIRDLRFEAHLLGFRWDDGDSYYATQPEIEDALAEVDWSDTAIIAHHAQFDGLILSHHYGVKPKFWFDTLSMARLLVGNHLSVGLESLAKQFGLRGKQIDYVSFKNKHFAELSPRTLHDLGAGCQHDCEITWQLFQKLAPQMPPEEFEVIDSLIRMFTEPVLQADTKMLGDLWAEEETRKVAASADLNIDPAELQSSAKFAELLRAEGVEPETKTSPKGKQIYAFAKTDQFMSDLQEHDNPRVQALALARIGAKSTILQTRAATLGWMASRGPLPVYLRYCGASTLRPSGGDGANWLNFKRRSPIRPAIMAPDGYLLGPIDSSQIECRVLHYLAGGPDEPVIRKFRANEDPYVDLASQFYKEQIYKPKFDDPRKDEMEAKRGMGKQGRLMCGYGAAGAQFKHTARIGLYGPSVQISIEDADAFVSLYRKTNPSICSYNTGYWAQAERMIARLGSGPPVDWGPLHVKDHRIYLPSGQAMMYDTLEYYVPGVDEEVRDFEREGFWRMRTRQGWKKMWGSKLTQNICEAVSRVIVTQAQVRITRKGYRVLNHPYDELLCLIPKDGFEQEHLENCRQEMLKAPDWLPGLPLDAEALLGERYSK